MTAYSTTTRDIANALLGKARHNQTVRVVKSRHGGYCIYGGFKPSRFVVLVDGQFFEVSERGLDLLRSGEMTVAELDLEPMSNDEIEAFGEE